jgi:hypothetical protein
MPRQTITARINQKSSGAQKVSVTVPSASSAGNLRSLNDVDTSTLNDGAIIQYNASSGKFETKNEIITSTGTLTIDGGTF